MALQTDSPLESAGSSGIAIHFHDVAFAFDKTPVLSNASFHIACGRFAAIVGPNGAGKSTLLKLMLGLIKPHKGKILVLGHDPSYASLDLGYVPQHSSYDPAFPIRVSDVVRMGLVHGMAARKHNREAVEQAMEATAITGLANRSFNALSGGQRRRVLLARALVCNPSLLLLDEPTANLDTESEDRLFQILEGYKGKKTMVLVSHDSDFVSALTDMVLCVGTRELPGAVVYHRTVLPGGGDQSTLRVMHDTLVEDEAAHCTLQHPVEP